MSIQLRRGAIAVFFLMQTTAHTKPWDLSACAVKKDQVEQRYADLLKRSDVRREILAETLLVYDCFAQAIKNPRYLVVIDYKLHSSKKRFFLIEMPAGKMKPYLTAHGRGSDPNHSGYAHIFSDIAHSKASSLGFFTTAEIYQGGHGKTLSLDGHSPTNQNARQRSVVIHGAAYVDPSRDKMGRSWGCPSLATKDLDSVVDKIKGGALVGIFK